MIRFCGADKRIRLYRWRYLSTSFVIVQIHVYTIQQFFILLEGLHLLRRVYELSGEIQTKVDIVAVTKRKKRGEKNESDTCVDVIRARVNFIRDAYVYRAARVRNFSLPSLILQTVYSRVYRRNSFSLQPERKEKRKLKGCRRMDPIS